MTKKTILEIYALAVCFFTVACFVVALGLMMWNVVELTASEFTIHTRDFECHRSDEAYRKCREQDYEYTKADPPKTFPTGDALTEKRERSYEFVLKSEKREALQGIVHKLIVILIDIFVFYVHWLLARRARESYT